MTNFIWWLQMYQSLLLFTKPKHGCTNLSSFKKRREYQFSLVLELYPHCWCLLCVVGSHVDMTCTSRLKNMLGGEKSQMLWLHLLISVRKSALNSKCFLSAGSVLVKSLQSLRFSCDREPSTEHLMSLTCWLMPFNQHYPHFLFITEGICVYFFPWQQK